MSIEKEIEKVGPSWTTITSQNMDCETAALMRAVIRPIFTSAATWAGLVDILREKGYRLAFQRGRMCVMDRNTGERLFGLRFLDIEMNDLVRRMGRPIVVARGDSADGELLRARPAIGGS